MLSDDSVQVPAPLFATEVVARPSDIWPNTSLAVVVPLSSMACAPVLPVFEILPSDRLTPVGLTVVVPAPPAARLNWLKVIRPVPDVTFGPLVKLIWPVPRPEGVVIVRSTAAPGVARS